MSEPWEKYGKATGPWEKYSTGSKPSAPTFVVDPTEGMTTAEKFWAGFGKAGADTLRGLGQMVGLVSRDDVAEARRLDNALMKTTAGTVGNVGGNVATLLPTAFIPGVNTIKGASLIGGLTGLAQPSASTTETLTNTGIGAAAAPLAIGAVRAGGALYEGAKGLVEPFSKAGQERIAAQVLRTSATDPAAASANAVLAQEIVPGSLPTLAQASRDKGLAQLERTLLNNPETASGLTQRMTAQQDARLQQLRQIAGTDGAYDAAVKARSAAARQNYSAAMANGIDQGTADVMQSEIASLMRRPVMQEAAETAKRIAANRDVTLTDMGSVEGLHWMKKALDDKISKAAQSGVGDIELGGMVQTKMDLMQVLEQIAPAYKTANDAYAKASKPINSMEVAQSLLDTLYKPGSQWAPNSAKEMGAQYRAALAKAQDSVKKILGVRGSIYDVMTPDAIQKLENVAIDLGRKEFSQTAGQASGSPTAQNMISQNLIRRILGPTGAPEKWSEASMLQTLLSPVQKLGQVGGAQANINNLLADAMLDPQLGARLLLTQPTGMQGLLGLNTQRMLTPYVAPIGLLGANASRQ